MTTMISFQNDWTVFFSRPVSGITMALAIAALLLPMGEGVSGYGAARVDPGREEVVHPQEVSLRCRSRECGFWTFPGCWRAPTAP